MRNPVDVFLKSMLLEKKKKEIFRSNQIRKSPLNILKYNFATVYKVFSGTQLWHLGVASASKP